MPKRPKITHQQQATMAAGLAAGKSQDAIAREVGVTQAAVSKHIRKPEVRLLAVEMREEHVETIKAGYGAMVQRLQRTLADPDASPEQWLAAGRLLIDLMRVDSQTATRLRVAAQEAAEEATTAGHTAAELALIYARLVRTKSPRGDIDDGDAGGP